MRTARFNLWLPALRTAGIISRGTEIRSTRCPPRGVRAQQYALYASRCQSPSSRILDFRLGSSTYPSRILVSRTRILVSRTRILTASRTRILTASRPHGLSASWHLTDSQSHGISRTVRDEPEVNRGQSCTERDRRSSEVQDGCSGLSSVAGRLRAEVVVAKATGRHADACSLLAIDSMLLENAARFRPETLQNLIHN